MKTYLSLAAFVLVVPVEDAAAAGGPTMLCMWTIKDKKNTGLNEDGMMAPCTEKTLSGGKFFASLFEAQGRKFRVEYQEDPQGADPFKARVNGKLGTMQEENRYSKRFTSDDLSIEFSYDSVLPDPALLKMAQGSWAKDSVKNCHSDDPNLLTIRGSTLTKFESQCTIYSFGRTTVADTTMIMMKCTNEDMIDYEALPFTTTNRGREAYTSNATHRFRCNR